MGLFGMTQYIGQVGGNIFVNFAVSGAIQIPGNFLSWWAMNALGRRVTMISSNTVAGAASLLLIVVPQGTAKIKSKQYFISLHIPSLIYKVKMNIKNNILVLGSDIGAWPSQYDAQWITLYIGKSRIFQITIISMNSICEYND